MRAFNLHLGMPFMRGSRCQQTEDDGCCMYDGVSGSWVASMHATNAATQEEWSCSSQMRGLVSQAEPRYDYPYCRYDSALHRSLWSGGALFTLDWSSLPSLMGLFIEQYDLFISTHDGRRVPPLYYVVELLEYKNVDAVMHLYQTYCCTYS